MSQRALQVGGVALVGGVGYYMYKAGGDPKAAQKRAEGTYSPSPTPSMSLSSHAPPIIPFLL